MLVALVVVCLVSGNVFAQETRVSGPYVHENLAVYLLHGEAVVPQSKVHLSLQQGMAEGKVVVHETQEVRRLTIENKSDRPVFAMAGEIVKGGLQDRVMARDLVIEPNSGRVPIEAFCVEKGRWTGRGKESTEQFSSSDHSLPSKSLKLAARSKRDQGEVWAGVDEITVSGTAGPSTVQHEAAAITAFSMSSLPERMEQPEIVDSVKPYLDELSGLVSEKGDVVGFAFALGSEINSVDSFRSPDFFRAVWPKLLRAAATEASDSEIHGPVPPKEAVYRFWMEALKASSIAESTLAGTQTLTRDSNTATTFETRDMQGLPLRTQVLAK